MPLSRKSMCAYMARYREENPRVVWAHMVRRCHDPKYRQFRYYGGRGIRVCNEWRFSFSAFRGWALVNGWKRGLQIDRQHNDGNYEPENCRFVTNQVNNQNKRNNKLAAQDIPIIRNLLAEKLSKAEIGRKFKVTAQLIGKIALGKSWGNV